MPSRQVIHKVRLAAFWILVYEGEEAAVMLLTPPVITIFRLRLSWMDMYYLDPPVQNQSALVKCDVSSSIE